MQLKKLISSWFKGTSIPSNKESTQNNQPKAKQSQASAHSNYKPKQNYYHSYTRSSFYNDIQKEQYLGQWLDKYFYSHFTNIYTSIERNTDEELQKKGVDVIIQKPTGETLYIDEKATLDYINQDIPTFAFEIMNSSSGARGWLYNPDYLTTDYLLVWPFADNTKIINSESFTKANVLSVSRDAVIKLLESKGITEDNLLQKVHKHFQEHSTQTKYKITNGIKLVFNTTKAEKPVILVISRTLLEPISTYHSTIYKNKT